nr:Chain E, Heme-Peptide Fragment [synthetic construct]
KTTCNACHQ